MAKKLLAMLLCVVMAQGLLTGCGNDSDTKSNDSDTKSNGAEQSDVSSDEEEVRGEPVSLRLVQFAAPGERNMEFFEGEYHDKVLEDLNIDLTIEFNNWDLGVVGNQLAAGESGAFMYNPPIDAWVSKGYLASITEEQFNEYAPNLVNARMGASYDFQKVNGEIYMIGLGGKVWAGAQSNLTVRQELLDEVGMNYADIDTLEEFYTAMDAVLEKHPDYYVFSNLENHAKAFDGVILPDGVTLKNTWRDICVVNEEEPESDEVISWYESEYWENYVNLMRDFYNKGYIKDEHLTQSPKNPQEEFSVGNGITTWGATSRIYNHTDGSYTFDNQNLRYLQIGDKPNVITINFDWGFVISKADEDKVNDWLRYFDWVYASEENYMMTLYGAEGTDYTVDENGVITKITSDSFMPGWQWSSMVYQPINTEVYDAAEVETYLGLDKAAINSKKAGFSFDSSEIESIASAVQLIVDEEVMPFAYGQRDFSEFAEVLKNLKDAGLDKYVEEYQRQFSEFMANK